MKSNLNELGIWTYIYHLILVAVGIVFINIYNFKIGILIIIIGTVLKYIAYSIGVKQLKQKEKNSK